MEDLLHLYSLPYNEHLPIVCFDELPVQLLGEVVTPLPMKAGQPKRLDYEYARQGVARCSWPLSFDRQTLGRNQQAAHESRLLSLHAASGTDVPAS
jgi:uncharacterized protein YodC (DUF2158 family)